MGHYRALDGLRGVAILLVVIYHAWRHVLPGGSYGVTLFFVLSGFLITGLLLRDGADLGRFYWNRAVRLLPALAVFLAGYILLFRTPGHVLWPLTYSSNFAYLAGAELGAVSHTWSLAVEEHFYILWPLVIGWIHPGRRLRATVGLLAVATVYRMAMVGAGAGFSRVNLGTDTVAFALLAGCVLAIAHHEGRLVVPSRTVTFLATIGLIVAAALVPSQTDAYLWAGFAVVALAGVAVAGCLREVWFLEWRWLRWFGAVSYGLYLWHSPLLSVGWALPRLVMLGTAVGVAWLSFQYVEEPLRRRFRRPRPALPVWAQPGESSQQPGALAL